MTSQHHKAKQLRRSQFSLALLFLIVTISALFSSIWLRKPPAKSLYFYDGVDSADHLEVEYEMEPYTADE